MTHEQIIRRALRILDARMREPAAALTSPSAVRDYLRLLLHDRPHEVFVCVFLDSRTGCWPRRSCSAAPWRRLGVPEGGRQRRPWRTTPRR